jgi:hypothetical protein
VWISRRLLSRANSRAACYVATRLWPVMQCDTGLLINGPQSRGYSTDLPDQVFSINCGSVSSAAFACRLFKLIM